jgi:hypothetical protein
MARPPDVGWPRRAAVVLGVVVVLVAGGPLQAFGLLDPARRGPAGAKQGWLCCLRSSIDLHSAGFLDGDGRSVLAIMSNQPFGYGAARTVLDDATTAIRARLDL